MNPRQAAITLAAIRRTWGFRGAGRRLVYEAQSATGVVRRREHAWRSATSASTPRLRALGFTTPRPWGRSAADPTDGRLTLYGGLDVEMGWPPRWHRHPVSGAPYEPLQHWTTYSDAGRAGDIKDVWEPSRLTWLVPFAAHAACSTNTADHESVWSVLEDWVKQNPPYLGPAWMCGQESSLRAIVAVTVADILRDSPATTEHRRTAVARLVLDTVGRVHPTLGYALSQRNNHAISEAAFLWASDLLVDGLPKGDRWNALGARALTEAVEDQILLDGSYAQHSPTYHRLALHVLLWCHAVGRATGAALPDGIDDAIARSFRFLRALLVPGTDGRVPNLGPNDGALLLDVTGSPISDFRPLLAHAAAAAGVASGLPSGPWDDEPRWFGLEPTTEGTQPVRPNTINVHPFHGARASAILRAGPIRHRPNQADQLHVDVWVDGVNVALDPGSYRYSAPPPWQGPFDDERVHNAPRGGVPQARRMGRFAWRDWAEARVVATDEVGASRAIVVALRLRDGSVLTRLVVSEPDVVAIADLVDDESATTVVRWNLPSTAEVSITSGRTAASDGGWRAAFRHGPRACVLDRNDGDPASGWWSPTYAVREPACALEVGVDASGRAAAAFGPSSAEARITTLVDRLATFSLRPMGDLDALLRPR